MTISDLLFFVKQQVKSHLCFDINLDIQSVSCANGKVLNILKKSSNRYFSHDDCSEVCFSVYNTCHYCIFLYFLSNIIFKRDKNGLNAEKLYFLNKILNSVDIFYEIDLPNIFYVEHPVGSVIGRASIGDYFFFHQGCTVGENFGDWPVIGKNVSMFTNSIILGKSFIGNNVIVSANAYIINETIPDNSIVFGSSPNLIIKTYDEKYIKEKLSRFWKY